MRLFLIVILLAQLLFADDYSDTPDVQQTQLYVSYEKKPKKVYLNQVFSITLKTLSTEENFEDIIYKFSLSKGVKLLSTQPKRKIVGRYFHDTFSFIATSEYITLPKITATIKYSEFHSSDATYVSPIKLHAIKLRVLCIL